MAGCFQPIRITLMGAPSGRSSWPNSPRAHLASHATSQSLLCLPDPRTGYLSPTLRVSWGRVSPSVDRLAGGTTVSQSTGWKGGLGLIDITSSCFHSVCIGLFQEGENRTPRSLEVSTGHFILPFLPKNQQPPTDYVETRDAHDNPHPPCRPSHIYSGPHPAWLFLLVTGVPLFIMVTFSYS